MVISMQSAPDTTRSPRALLTAHGLTKRYGPVHALDNVSLTIGTGESIAVMGTSGSGKTTLVHVLAGILTPDAGSVMLGGAERAVEVNRLNDAGRSRLRRERFGFVFQQGMLIPELTAVENAAVPLMLTGVARADAEPYAAQWLAALGLAGMEHRRIGELSGGQAQRVAIARAQVTSPSIVFADEPTGALDSRTSAEVLTALLHATTGQGRTLVMVTHDESVARRCSRIISLSDGQIISDTGAAVAR